MIRWVITASTNPDYDEVKDKAWYLNEKIGINVMLFSHYLVKNAVLDSKYWIECKQQNEV